MGTESHEHEILADGRRLVVWHTPAATGHSLPPIVLAPGFGRRMDHLGAVALYLSENGFDVYRYDGLDHVGLSDGAMTEFTMTAALESLAAVTNWVCESRDIDSVGVCAMSLGARVAYRLAATSDRVRFLATAVGVVHLRQTLNRVWGIDLGGMTDDELPDYVEFEKKYIGTHRFAHDARKNHWFDLETTIAELAGARAPIACFASLDDEWVAPHELRAAFGKGAGRRHVVELEGGVHDLGQNPAAARIFVQRLVQTALDLAGEPAREIAEPSFEALVERALEEGRRERAKQVRIQTPTGRIARMLPPSGVTTKATRAAV